MDSENDIRNNPTEADADGEGPKEYWVNVSMSNSKNYSSFVTSKSKNRELFFLLLLSHDFSHAVFPKRLQAMIKFRVQIMN